MSPSNSTRLTIGACAAVLFIAQPCRIGSAKEKAELKYITVRTAEKEHIFDGALSDLEQKYAHLFVRVHRNALVARRCVRAVEKHHDPVEGEGWTVRLDGCDERLAVSRRQLAAVRESLMG